MNKILFLLCFICTIVNAQNKPILIEDGLIYSEINAKKSIVGDSKISVLKIDPNKFDLTLINAKELKSDKKTIEAWAKDQSLIAGINAGMFQQDQKTNVGYMQNFDFINSSSVNKDNTILAFNRKDTTVPKVQIIDRTCQKFNELKSKYNTLIQRIRMIDCNQKNKWSQQEKMWSTVAIGIDKSDQVIFLFTRSPYTVHDFIDIILNSDLNIHNAMYLEGGPEASFILNTEPQIVKFGSYETGFYESDDNNQLWPIPNVIGVVKR